MADALVKKTLDTAHFSQVVACKKDARALRIVEDDGALKLEVYEDAAKEDGPGFRVWIATDSEDASRFNSDWYLGRATVSSTTYRGYAQPVSIDDEADEYTGGYFHGPWSDTEGYSEGDIVRSNDALYVCRVSISPSRGGGGTAPENDTAHWDLVLDSSSTVADGSITEAKLANNAVTTAKLASGAVTGGQISNGAVSEGKIGNYQVSSIKIDTGAVTSAKIADTGVTESKIASNAVTSSKIGALAVDSTKIADGAVTNTKLGSGAVTNGKIQDATITGGKLVDGTVTGGKIGTISNANLPSYGISYLKLAGDIREWQIQNSYAESIVKREQPVEPFMPWRGEIVGTFNNRRTLSPFQLDRFLGRGSELAMDLDGTALSSTQIQNLTNQSYGQAIQIAAAGGNTGVLTIDMVTNGMVSTNGFTYAQGYLMVTFYSGRGPVSMSARTKDRNGTWTTRTCTPHMTSSTTAGATEAVYWGVQLSGNYVTHIELTMTSQSGQQCGMGNISYLGTRMTMGQGPSITTLGGNFYGTISGVEQGTTNWSINQDGDADVTSLDVTNNITVGGTVDGRDIAADGSKLDGIDTGATSDENLGNADQTLTASRTIDDGNNGYLFFVDLEDTGKKSQILMNPGNPNILVQANDTGAGNVTAFTVGSENLNLQFTGTSDLRINNDAGSSGQVLTSNGTGNAPSWETPGSVTFAAGDVTSQTVTTSYTVVTTNSPSINTAGITFSSSVFTVPAALAGKYISFAMTLDASQTSGNNRVELDLALQKFNGSTWDTITKITNYAQRANSHDSGGVTMAESFDLSGALSGGEQYRWTIRQAGTPTTATSVLSSYTIKVYS